jgi:hypothetical protein
MLFSAAARHYAREGNRVIGTVEEFLATAHKRLAVARNCINNAHTKMEEIYNQDHRRPDFHVGDYVYLRSHRGDQQLRIQFPGIGPAKALAPARLGPYPITEKVTPNAYRLKLPPGLKIHDVLHARYLTKDKPSRLYPNHREDSDFDNPPEFMDEETGEEVFEVDKILHKRVQGKGTSLRTQYLVKWKGYPIDMATWEPLSGLVGCDELLPAFEAEAARLLDAQLASLDVSFDESAIGESSPYIISILKHPRV